MFGSNDEDLFSSKKQPLAPKPVSKPIPVKKPEVRFHIQIEA